MPAISPNAFLIVNFNEGLRGSRLTNYRITIRHFRPPLSNHASAEAAESSSGFQRCDRVRRDGFAAPDFPGPLVGFRFQIDLFR
jgi:hypothetical protein